jgi:UDPglucose 6-dehydrogenase
MRVSVIGTGYVGLVTGGCLAALGHQVWCTDNDLRKLETLESGRLPIYEPGLDSVIQRARSEGRFRVTKNPVEAVNAAEAIMICVGTPPAANGEADLSAIESVAYNIASHAKSAKLVIEKSTVPARTGHELKRALSVYGRKRGLSFRVASNPEFLREGTAVEDFMHPDRIVVGVEDDSTERQMREMYKPLLEQQFECPVHDPVCPAVPAPSWMVTTISGGELIKHASNSFLALKISYANMVAELAEKLGADIEQVLRAVGMDPRIGNKFLSPGLGFGGFCLPKDVQAFIHLAGQLGVDFSMLKEAEKINKRCITRFMDKVREALWILKGKRIGFLGLAFKPRTDDIRFSSALELATRLAEEGADVRAYDPEAMEKARGAAPQLQYASSAYEAARDAEALIVATEWQEFQQLRWDEVYQLMARPLVLDGRNCLPAARMKSMGFEFYSVGSSRGQSAMAQVA